MMAVDRPGFRWPMPLPPVQLLMAAAWLHLGMSYLLPQHTVYRGNDTPLRAMLRHIMPPASAVYRGIHTNCAHTILLRLC